MKTINQHFVLTLTAALFVGASGYALAEQAFSPFPGHYETVLASGSAMGEQFSIGSYKVQMRPTNGANPWTNGLSTKYPAVSNKVPSGLSRGPANGINPWTNGLATRSN